MNFVAEVPAVVERDDEEAEWIGRARQGDEAAWEVLVRRYQQPVFRLAYLILRDAGDAEDVAQEAFVRAFLSLHTFDLSRPLRPWLMRITVNLARNRRRSLGRYLANLRRAFEKNAEPAYSESAAGDRAQQHWQAHTLWQAVQQLNQIGQEVVYCRYFLDLSEAETAEALDIAPGTVKSRLSRAIQRLRQVIEADFPALRDAFEEE
jgi:RNA polymerase sigma-70 factor (ECF subfamily)